MEFLRKGILANHRPYGFCPCAFTFINLDYHGFYERIYAGIWALKEVKVKMILKMPGTQIKVIVNNPEIIFLLVFYIAIGYVYIAKSAKGVCRISFPYATDEGFLPVSFKRYIPLLKACRSANIKVQRNNAALEMRNSHFELQYFQGKQVDFDFPLDLSDGTTFQENGMGEIAGNSVW